MLSFPLPLKSDSHLPKKKNVLICLIESPLKIMKNAKFHLKSSFCSQDIYIFVKTFWSCRKNGLIRKIRLTSKFMTSQPRQQAITIHILPNISQSKENQTIKLRELIEYKKRNISKIMLKMRQRD